MNILFWRKNREEQESSDVADTTSLLNDDLESGDLPITLYLNQRVAFDILAVIEDGFSHFTTVQTTVSGESATATSGEVKLGASNVFALLGIQLSSSRHAGQKHSESATERKVHTPSSLFARLRRDLHRRKLVRFVSDASDLSDLSPGEFVEFEATLRKNPLAELLDAFLELMPVIRMASTDTGLTDNRRGQRGQRQAGRSRGKRDDTALITEQINLMKSALVAEGSQDLVAEMGQMRVVLTADQDFFVDPSMNDTIDGTFRVFGKTTRVILDHNETIGLLRKTALGKVADLTEGFAPMMESMQDSGFSGSTETEIPGPTMQVIPIAIFA